MSTLDKHLRLAVLAEQIKTCTRCELHANRTHATVSRGSHNATVMFVGEAPSEVDDETGIPFMGHAGQLLDRMIVAMGLAPEEVFLAHVCRCVTPAHRSPTPEETAACVPHLHEQIQVVAPRVIVTLGTTAARAILGDSRGLKTLRGEWRIYRHGRAVIPVMPTYHPAYLLRETQAGRVDAKASAWKDLQSVMARLGREVRP